MKEERSSKSSPSSPANSESVEVSSSNWAGSASGGITNTIKDWGGVVGISVIFGVSDDWVPIVTAAVVEVVVGLDVATVSCGLQAYRSNPLRRMVRNFMDKEYGLVIIDLGVERKIGAATMGNPIVVAARNWLAAIVL
jgi:hypothetical protein